MGGPAVATARVIAFVAPDVVSDQVLALHLALEGAYVPVAKVL